MNNDFPKSAIPNKSSPILRLNAICPYFTMFPIDFPFNTLSSAQPGDWILDPFCGRGTTNFAARLHGLPSMGIDSNPVASSIAASKFVQTNPRKIIDLCEKILKDNSEPDTIPEGKFWDLCYHPQTLLSICKLREELLLNCKSEERIALRALILGILHGPKTKGTPSYLSNQMPRTYATKPDSAINFWEKNHQYPQFVDVERVVSRRSEFTFSKLPPSVNGNIIKGDSRRIHTKKLINKFKWIVTSPPYFGMHSYIPDQWIRHWFIGGESKVIYTKDKQIGHNNEKQFIHNLAHVWKNITQFCSDGANMIIRFGALPSLPVRAREILEKSICDANCGWEIMLIKSAGHPPNGRRQSEQFKLNLGNSQDEIDLYAKLREN